ncbi:uncharacterized protein LOC21385042 isoform X2 [Morus notabilis]|uniref:uncharacterized protein LOC21385042 isoform X2 n=1 Tax=Morus notabilis TaxID=981085 RepID=UPI000CED1F05|nr:uncharacterized protein LOC21385042 isoform X2 [Morus notabilis]
MGGSRRKYKKSRPKVRVGLPKKKPNVFKPAFNFPPKLRSLLEEESNLPKWDDQASVIQNYKSFGVVSNPNLLGVRSRTPHLIQSDSLQVPLPPPTSNSNGDAEFDGLADTGSDLEEDDLKSALGKKRRDGKSAPPQPLTALQRRHIGLFIEKHGDDYQHSVATLEKLCGRYHMCKDKNPLICPS